MYFDNFATTKMDSRVFRAMKPYLKYHYGNASSNHCLGIKARLAVEKAREQVARLINCFPSQIVFTSGATESNNIVMLQPRWKKTIISNIEHKSVLLAAKNAEQMCVKKNGQITLEKTDCDVISIMGVNNEIGSVQNIGLFAQNKGGAFLHSDLAQALGKVDIDMKELDVDFASFSAHKIHGPKGVGALFVRNNDLSPITYGGGQESLRSGTLNVAGIVGFGKACDILFKEFDKINDKIHSLREFFMNELDIDGAYNIPIPYQVPHAINLYIPCKDMDYFMSRCLVENLNVSTSSACLSSLGEPSSVLINMGINREYAKRTLRICLSRFNTKREIRKALKKMKSILKEEK